MTKKIFKLWNEVRTLRREVKNLHKSLSNAEHINKCLLSSLHEKTRVTITDEDKKNKIKKLKENFTKLLDYTMQYVEICDVCPESSTCINSEGTCPMAGYKGSLKPLLLKQLGIIEFEPFKE